MVISISVPRPSGVKVVTIQPGAFRTNMVSGIEKAFTIAAAESEPPGAFTANGYVVTALPVGS